MVGSGETLLAGAMIQQKIDLRAEDLMRTFRGDDLHPLFVSLDSQKRYFRRGKSGMLKVSNIQGKCAPEVIEDRESPIDDAPLIHQSAGLGASNARDVLTVLVANGYIKLVDAETYAVVNSVFFRAGNHANR
jgi:hypothetical protein